MNKDLKKLLIKNLPLIDMPWDKAKNMKCYCIIEPQYFCNRIGYEKESDCKFYQANRDETCYFRNVFYCQSENAKEMARMKLAKQKDVG